ncbi:MAG: serine hydrolase, partial [Bacteroidota bacterium]
LSAIIQKTTGEKLVDYLDSRLWKPLNIPKPAWDTCPKGINTGGWGLHIRTEDIAKLGQLYLQKGMWNGKRLLSEDWVEMATTRQTSNGSNPDNDWEQGYGYQFWMCRHGAYRGDGAFGQFCIVMPEQDAVLVGTSGTYDMWKVMNIAWEELLPAFKVESLPENKMEGDKLQTQSSALALPPIKGQISSPLSKKLRKKTFQFEDNQAGIQSIQFDLHDDAHTIVMEMKGGTQTLEIGSGRYAKGELNQTIPYADRILPAIASSGAWTSDNEYQLRIYFSRDPARLTYTFKFEEDQVTWDSKLEYSIFGAQETPQLTGNVMTR